MGLLSRRKRQQNANRAELIIQDGWEAMWNGCFVVRMDLSRFLFLSFLFPFRTFPSTLHTEIVFTLTSSVCNSCSHIHIQREYVGAPVNFSEIGWTIGIFNIISYFLNQIRMQPKHKKHLRHGNGMCFSKLFCLISSRVYRNMYITTA